MASAYQSTGIPHIEVYMALPTLRRRLLWATRFVRPILAMRPVQAFLKSRVRSGKPGPTPAERARGRSLIWGIAEDGKTAVRSRLETPEGYTLTAITSVLMVQKALAGNAPAGYQTPSSAYGADLIMEVEGVVREDVE